jgi:hypothetical protein
VNELEVTCQHQLRIDEHDSALTLLIGIEDSIATVSVVARAERRAAEEN